MKKLSNKDYLKNIQYGTAKNHDARIALHERYTPSGNDIWDFVWNNYSFDQDSKILEVSCGNGQFWKFFNITGSYIVNLTITVFSSGMLGKAKENLTFLRPHCRFEISDVEKLQYDSHAFDVVLSHFMLYHAS